METRKIILTRGIQGAGKSFFARNWVLEDPEHRVRFNNDDIRNMLGKYWVPSRESVVREMKTAFIIQSMKNGYDIIVDNMNLNPKEIEYYKLYIKAHNDTVEDLRKEKALNPADDFKYELEFKDFKTPVNVCIERDSKREHPIGAKIITETYNRYKDFYNEISGHLD